MNTEFLERMKQYLQVEYETYVSTLSDDMYRGLRTNPCKCDKEEILNMHLCELRPSPICPYSFYLPKEIQGIGNHPAHLAGLFYMQEPSASSAVEILDVQPGDWVLDLCSAPGGKSTQIAAKLAHSGFLVSNEIDKKRAMILLSNMERMGFGECMITNSHPSVLCEEMKGCFDRVLVDAPCSGEGMFKKHSKAMEDWSIEHVQACAQRQELILHSAYEALKEDGVLVYSTCTYSMEENEQTVYAFLQQHEDMELMTIDVPYGRKGFAYKDLAVEKVMRIFPMDGGEGHFVAKFKKHGKTTRAKVKELANEKVSPVVLSFLGEQITSIPDYITIQQDKVYLKTKPFLQLKKSRVLRQGILAGEIVKNRIEPHQHFYTASLLASQYKQQYAMSWEECQLFLKGHQLSVSGYKGYTLMSWENHPIGFTKGDGTVLKNKYPKGLRIH